MEHEQAMLKACFVELADQNCGQKVNCACRCSKLEATGGEERGLLVLVSPEFS